MAQTRPLFSFGADPDTRTDSGIVLLINFFEKTSDLTLCYHELSRPDFFDNLHHIREGIKRRPSVGLLSDCPPCRTDVGSTGSVRGGG